MQQLRLDFWEEIRNVPVKDLVFLDEAGVNLALIRLYARASRDRRVRGSRPHKRGKNVSMIGAISLRGIITAINLFGSIGGLTFKALVIRKLIPKLWKGAVVVWDNYSIHKADATPLGFPEQGNAHQAGQEIEKAILESYTRL